jgi:hypothetical protein
MTDTTKPKLGSVVLTPQAKRRMAELARDSVAGLDEQVLLAIFGDHLKAIDKWIVAQGDPAIDRPEAIRRLVEIGLKANQRKHR